MLENINYSCCSSQYFYNNNGSDGYSCVSISVFLYEFWNTPLEKVDRNGCNKKKFPRLLEAVEAFFEAEFMHLMGDGNAFSR